MRKRKTVYLKVVILCIATLILTYGMGKYFETMYLRYADYGGVKTIITDPNVDEKSSEADSEDTQYVAETGFSVFLIQNGVYSVKGGAESQASLLEMDGFKPCVYYENNYRVVTGIYIDKDKALSQIEKQRELGYDNFLLEVKVPDFVFQVYTEEEKFDLERIISKFKKTLSNTQAYFDNLEDYQTIDLSLVNYSGEEPQIIQVIEIIESYHSWHQNQDKEFRNLFLSALSKYLRKIG